MKRGLLLFAACAGLLASGCATAPRDPAALAEFKANNDPLEPLNRRVFDFNGFLDKVFWKPAAKAYRSAVPDVGRTAVRSFLANLNEPLIFGNDVLQGRLGSARITLERLVINTTVGIGGLHDVAKHNRLPHQTGDFGQTLHVWGFGEGPYLVIPVTGPSNPRDLVGFVVSIYGDPVRYVTNTTNYPESFSIGRTFLSGIDERAQNLDTLDELQRESVDYYAALRSLFRQKRAGELEITNPGKTPQPENFYDDPGAAPAPSGNAAQTVTH